MPRKINLESAGAAIRIIWRVERVVARAGAIGIFPKTIARELDLPVFAVRLALTSLRNDNSVTGTRSGRVMSVHNHGWGFMRLLDLHTHYEPTASQVEEAFDRETKNLDWARSAFYARQKTEGAQ